MAFALAVTGCGSSADDDNAAADGSATAASQGDLRPLTADEAQRLAIMRFTNFNTGVRAVRFEVTDSGARYAVDGWVDFESGLGYAGVHDNRADGGQGPLLVAWSEDTISSHDPVGDDEAVPLPPPDTATGTDAWTSSSLSPAESRLHAALAVVLAAGSDRPDNPLLLRQTDARWLRSDEVDGVPADVILGPTHDEAHDPATSTAAPDGSDATLRYWIDDDGLLMRMEVRLGGGAEWTVVDFDDASDVSFADAFLDKAE
ncbi:hypothetical protein G1H11_12120 [Phytoactinopolyspora alkaliphila]|uniref:LppX_LprAFG lipoprotein n=1 Tax=Phytoactinopolyspora alkaliphila TaxID=1783498 RepID=A0A6N9YM52_9ACTN|nr:hypothetical protein [Phytoactinopolyspora alkaliphila]NED96054.1 hypothetical protein [Phytoactinopolyspora alkaliphila]